MNARASGRSGAYDWQATAADLDAYGCAVLPEMLLPEECRSIAASYPDEGRFRSHIHMARHGFGKGEYRYFKYPLPDLVARHPHSRPSHRRESRAAPSRRAAGTPCRAHRVEDPGRFQALR